MENIPYRNKALKNRKKDKQVIVVEVNIPGWLPGVVMLAIAGKCGQMIYRRMRKFGSQGGLDEEYIRRHRQFEEYKERQRTQLTPRYSYAKYKDISPLEQTSTLSLPLNKVEDNDSANEDSLSEYSRIPSPRQRDQESPLTPFEIYESCFNDDSFEVDSVDLDNCYEDYALQAKDSLNLDTACQNNA
eukprot:TRINITY_DN2308_c0_g2_i1.p1 TRINITY_DN2308_c0_g2~~TRINITY_DN2308_c0_g2_i1.p1  ORF type:complete len:187 (+),score=17.26 TRINITY_DN2308_c0_g2_i1:109-669(+)